MARSGSFNSDGSEVELQGIDKGVDGGWKLLIEI
jgi:hypothetical protein